MFKKRKDISLLVILFLIGGFVLPLISSAQMLVPQIDGLTTADIKTVAGSIIQLFLGLLGLIALVIILYGGFVWMTSGGNEEKISKAKRILSAGVIGLVIIMASYAITTFILDSIQGALNGSSSNPQTCIEDSCYGCDRCDSNGVLTYDSTCQSWCTNSSGSFDLEAVWHSPIGNDVSLCSMIQVKFNAQIDEASMIPENFKLYECLTYDTIINQCVDIGSPPNNLTDEPDSQFTLSNSGKVIKFTLGEDYKEDTYYVVDLPINGIKQDGVEEYLSTGLDWTFKTGDEPDTEPPTVINVFPDGVDVCLNSYIEIEFSEDMDLDSLEQTEAFRLYEDFDPDILSNIEFAHNAQNTKLTVYPDRNYIPDHDYYPLLERDVIKDTCGNPLDGNFDTIVQETDVDDYPSSGPSLDWTFKTGQNEYCEPQITDINPGDTYYDDLLPLTIEGYYLFGGTTVIFDDNVIVHETDNLCLNNAYWPDAPCADGAWQADEIKIFVPADGGDSIGAKAGNITVKVQTDQGSTSGTFNLLSPRIDNLSPDMGGRGQYITVLGENFGDWEDIDFDLAEVFFRSNSGEYIEAELPCGQEGWQDDHIIITAPDILDFANNPYRVQIKKVLDNGDIYWSNLIDFIVTDDPIGPGLCSISEETIEYEQQFVLSGFMLGDGSEDREVVLGDEYDSISLLGTLWSIPINGQDTAAEATTPNLSAANDVGVRVAVEIDGEWRFSNYLNVDITSSSANAFYISYLSSSTASVGEYLTIHGSGFGNSHSSGKTVKFFNDTATWPEGDFDFPSACSSVYWQDDQIIVKVPDEFINLPFASQVKVVDGSNETNVVTLEINDEDPAPSICSVNPEIGELGQELEIAGEYFEDVDVITFAYGTAGADDAIPNSVDDELIKVDVPDTETGLISAHNSNTNTYGNTWNFEYSGAPIQPTEVWDFYGWHFATCERCESPRVRIQSCDPNLGFSPSPAPGNRFVPSGSDIYVEFEYSNASDAEMDTSSYINNFTVYECSNGENPLDLVNCNIMTVNSFTAGNTYLGIDSLNLQIGYWYAVELSSDIVDLENSSLNEYSWYFRIDPYGAVCEPDTLNIEPNNFVKEYVALDDILYTGLLIDSENCYVCDSTGYGYEWESSDTSLVTIPDPNISPTDAVLNNDYNIGSLKIKATSTLDTLELYDDTNLYIVANCSFYDNNEDECLDETDSYHPDFDCCWDAYNNGCQNTGHPICNSPFVRNRNCVLAGFGYNPVLASPSPAVNAEYIVTDAHIYAEFAKSNVSVVMDQSTFAGGITILNCGTGAIPNPTCSSSGIPTIDSIDSGDNYVNYSHSGFAEDTWYKITLEDTITDTYGDLIVSKTWEFKTKTGICETENISLQPSNATVEVNTSKNYGVICYDSSCNVCDDTYTYDWSINDITIATIDGSNHSNINIAEAIALGDTMVRVENNELILEDTASLEVILSGGGPGNQCNLYDNLELECSDLNNTYHSSFDCCWDTVNSACLNEGNAICNYPFVREIDCEPSVVLGSPSPIDGTENVGQDTQIFMKFAKNGMTVSMDVATYVNGLVVQDCTDMSGNFDNNVCGGDLYTILNFSPGTNDSEVSYSHDDFDLDTWYKLTATENIKDIYGYSLQTKEWHFKVGEGLCSPTNLEVSPSNWALDIDEEKKYSTYCYDEQCNVCTNNYDYEWSVSDPLIASIQEIGSLGTSATATALSSGSTQITALNTDINLTDDANLVVNGIVVLDPLEILSNYPEDNSTDVCLNTLIKATFDMPINSDSLDGNVTLSSGGIATSTTYSVYRDFEGNGVLNIYAEYLLERNAIYEVVLTGGSGGIESIHGNELNCPPAGLCTWSFTTADLVCDLSYVKIVEPEEDYYEFNNPNETKGFIVEARSIYGDPIIPLANVYDWQWKWESLDESLVTLDPSNSANTIVTSANNNGTTRVKVTAYKIPEESICNTYDEITCESNACCWNVDDGICSSDLNISSSTACQDNLSTYEDKAGYKGIALSDEVEVELFMCENPWEFEDTAYNFKLKYCMDGGLPYLATTTGLIINDFIPLPGEDSLLREYIFKYVDPSLATSGNINLAAAKSSPQSHRNSGTSGIPSAGEKSMLSEIGLSELTDNRLSFKLLGRIFNSFISNFFDNQVLAAPLSLPSDIVGLRIYQNESHKSPIDWYRSSSAVNFQGSPSSIVINDYSGLKDGRTVYVNAANYIDNPFSPDTNIYTNLSLLSYNQNAGSETVNIFNQLVDNWTFNINVDADVREDIIEDVIRWQDLRTMEKNLNNYAFQNKYCAYISDPEQLPTLPPTWACSTFPIQYYHFDIDGDGNVDSLDEPNGEFSECYNVSSTVSCNSDSECQNHEMGFDKCVGVYPELNEGTYVQGISTSAWPSWRATLSNQMGSSLAVDPINEFSSCEDPDNPLIPYDEQTCWSVMNETFFCPTGSHMYYYQTGNSYNANERALSFDLYSLFNFNDNNNYFWSGVPTSTSVNSAFNPFNTVNIDNSSVCNNQISTTCGNVDLLGNPILEPGEECEAGDTITFCAGNPNEITVGCRYDCQWPTQPEICLGCGDGVVSPEYGEECEAGWEENLCVDSWNPRIATCDSNCHWLLDPPDPDYYCKYCGNAICESPWEDINSCYADCGDCGDTFCNPESEDAYSCYADCGSCGDSIVSGPEECDYTISIGDECFTINGYAGHFLCLDSGVDACTWSENCSADGVCGDEVVNGNELCEIGDIGPQCERSDGYYGNMVCEPNVCLWYPNTEPEDTWCPTSEFCGDEIVNGHEDCDTDEIDTNFCTAACEFNCEANGAGNPVGMVATANASFANFQSSFSASTDALGNINTIVNLLPARVSGDLSMHIEANVSGGNPITLGIVFVSDRSGSMGTTKMQYLKDAITGEDGALDTLSENSPNADVALISYSNDVTLDEDFQNIYTNLNQLKNTVNAYSASGSTYHKDALDDVIALFNANTYDRKVVIFMTDGGFSSGQYAMNEASTLKGMGVDIFSVGLIDATGDEDLISYLNGISSSECICSGSECGEQAGSCGNGIINCRNIDDSYEECDGNAGCTTCAWDDDAYKRNYHTTTGTGLNIMYTTIAQSISAGGEVLFNGQTINLNLEEDLGNPGHYFGDVVFPTECGQGDIVCEASHPNNDIPLTINLGTEFSFDVILSNAQYDLCPWADSSGFEWNWIPGGPPLPPFID